MRQHTPLLTLPRLGVSNFDGKAVNVKDIAATWFSSFAASAEKGDIENLSKLFVDESFWRDFLALTWDLRTFQGRTRITQFLSDRLVASKVSAFQLQEDSALLVQPTEDLAWIQALFQFQTEVGACSGVFRLVPLPGGEWKGYLVFTNLEDLKGFPEKIRHGRNADNYHGNWEEDMQARNDLKDGNPTVLIIGAGHSGLCIAARLNALGVSNLVVERHPRVGDSWRMRYKTLSLHDPVWYQHMPYLPFPPTWPVYTPAPKFANWLEAYANIMDLNVWTSSSVTSAHKDPKTGKWTINISRESGQERVLQCNHLVFATGLTSGKPNMPVFANQDLFKGQILHSSRYQQAKDYVGKKVVVIGACNSALDVAADCAEYDIDVTVYQRSSTYVMSNTKGFLTFFAGLYGEDAPPVDIGDRLGASFPLLMGLELLQRQTLKVAENDKDMLDGIKSRGFRTNLGAYDAGPLLLVWTRVGGQYLDTGACQHITDGKIKLKNDSKLSRFTEDGIQFEDGTELKADVVVFGTGVGDFSNYVREVVDEESLSGYTGVWGLTEEGELKGMWGNCGVDRMWVMGGGIAQCRFHSKHLALQIKAIEEGVFGTRYGP